MSKFQQHEKVLIEWLPADWREAIIIDVWSEKYFVKMIDMEVQLTVKESEIRKTNNEYEAKFF